LFHEKQITFARKTRQLAGGLTSRSQSLREEKLDTGEAGRAPRQSAWKPQVRWMSCGRIEPLTPRHTR
jgi:hypothetical protein